MEKRNFTYYGFFLTTESQNFLLDYLSNNEQYSPIMDKLKEVILEHCTLMFHTQFDENDNNSIQKLLNIQSFASLNKEFSLFITHIGYNDLAFAFKLEKNHFLKCTCANVTPHITIGTFENGKPYDSNNISDWIELSEPIEVFGTIQKR